MKLNKNTKNALIAAPLAVAAGVGIGLGAKPVYHALEEMGKTKQQSAEVKQQLERVIKPTAIRLASKAIQLSERPLPQLTALPDGKDPNKVDLVAYTGKGDASNSIEVHLSKVNGKLDPTTVSMIEISTGTCVTNKKGDADCKEGITIDLYSPDAKHKGQAAWEAGTVTFVEQKGGDLSGGVTDSADSDFYTDSNTAAGTARDALDNIDIFFDEAYNGE